MSLHNLFLAIDNWDHATFLWFNRLPHPAWLNTIALVIHVLTLTGVIFAFFSLWLYVSNNKQGRVLAFLTILTWFSAFCINFFVLKPAFNRSRPIIRLENVHIIGSIPDSNSFPSGQMTTAVAYSIPLFMYKVAKKYRYSAAVINLLTGLDRVYMGHHYPLDVLAGAFVGAIVGWMCTFLYVNQIAKKLRK